MDRLIHTALNSLANLRDQRVVSAQNMANLAVPGFRRDLSNEGGAFYVTGQEAHTARALQLERGPHGFSHAAGVMERTGDPMDIAIADSGFFYVRPGEGGEPALSRRGDLRLGSDGALVNGAGEAMLGQDMQPIVLPPFREMVVNDLGQIEIVPLDSTTGQRETVAVLATLDPQPELALRKSPDGRIRTADGSPLPAPDQRPRVVQGLREGSNVNATQEMIDSIELQRSFDINLRMISTAREMDEAGSAFLRPPSA